MSAQQVVSNAYQLPANIRAYLGEIAADIVAFGGIGEGETVEQAFIAAHRRRQAFAQEMAEGRTDRAKCARRILSAQVYGDALVSDAIERVAASDDYARKARFLAGVHS